MRGKVRLMHPSTQRYLSHRQGRGRVNGTVSSSRPESPVCKEELEAQAGKRNMGSGVQAHTSQMKFNELETQPPELLANQGLGSY